MDRGDSGQSGDHPRLTRRAALQSATAASLSLLAVFQKAHGMDVDPKVSEVPSYKYRNDRDDDRVLQVKHVHEGKGTIAIKPFFRDPRASRPAVLLIYDIPPGASEGVHTHNPGDEKEGSFDEFYYILSGTGVMQIDDEVVPVKPGDHIFTPNGVAHGIENTAREENLRVYLVAMIRD